MPLIFSVTSTIDEIPQDEWDELFGKGMPEGYGYHKTLEESNIGEFETGYLLAKRGGKLAAVLPFFINDFSFTTLLQGPLQKCIASLQKAFRGFLRTKMLFVGFPTTEELYLGISPEEDLEGVLGEALSKFSEISKDKKIKTVLFYNLSEKHKKLAEYLERKGFCRMTNYPNTKITLRAGSLEGYIESLGKNTRKDLRRKLKKSPVRGPLKTEILDDIGGFSGRIHELYMNNFAESDIHFEELTAEFFRDICRNMHGTAKYFITKDGENIAAFNLCLISGDTCVDKFVGFDKKVYRDYNLYYRTFLHNIEWCIKNGIRYYQMGITDYEPKLRLGAQLMPLYVYFKASYPLANLFSRPLAVLFKPENFDPALRKIKKQKAAFSRRN